MGAQHTILQSGLLNQSSAQVIDGSLKFDSGSSTYLKRTPSSAGNRKTWTLSLWYKLTSSSIVRRYLFVGYSGNNHSIVNFTSTGKFEVYRYAGGHTFQFITNPVFRDPNAWYHVVLNYDTTQATASDRIKLYINGEIVNTLDTGFTSNYPSQNVEYEWNDATSHNIGAHVGGGYADEYLSQYYLIDGLTLGPESFGFTDPLTNTWRPKKFSGDTTYPNNINTNFSSSLSASSGFNASYPANNAFDGNFESFASSAGGSQYLELSSSFTGVTSLRIQCAAGSGFTMDGETYTISGTGITSKVISTNGEAKSLTSISLTSTTISGIRVTSSSGLQARIVAIEINGIILKNNAGWGLNGFYLPFDGNSPIEEDKSGRGNNFTPVNFSGTSIDPDVLKDSPSGAVSGGRAQTGITTTSSAPSNYATLNPRNMHQSSDSLSDGNLQFSTTGNGGGLTESTLAMSSGKFYFESVFSGSQGGGQFAGIRKPGDRNYNNSYIYVGTSNKYTDGGSATSYGAGLSNGDIIGTAFDATNGTLTFYKNGLSQGIAFTGISGTYSFFVGSFGGPPAYKVNFGQKPFKYAPPQGFLPLNSASATPETVITRPDQYVGATLYSGNNGTTQVTTGFQPDFVWLKGRSEVLQHRLVDSVRGQHQLYSNSNAVQGDWDKLNILSNGFTVTNDGNEQNKSGTTYVSWSWKAGGNKNTFNVDGVGYASAAAAGLTGGLTVTGASVGTKQGFSIIKATGSNSQNSFKHGLGKVPKFVISKDIDNSRAWYIYHGSLGANYRASFDDVQFTSDSGYFGGGMTDTLVTLKSGGSGGNNYNGANMIYYIWADVPGLQKFGKYTGNNDSDAADGPFVELGFRPGLVAIKRSNGTGNWVVYDNKRDTFNPLDGRLKWNTSGANVDNSGYNIDFLSNGFKITGGSNDNYNAASDYIYAAWAEAPVSNLYGGQSNAR